MSDSVLVVNKLCKKYEDIVSVDEVSFSLKKGEIMSIIGPSGCGKSTILNILASLDSPTTGSVLYNNNEHSIGYMLQQDALLPWLTVWDNAILGLKIKKMDNSENLNYVSFLFQKFHLEEFKDKYPKNLSGGMRQRVL